MSTQPGKPIPASDSLVGEFLSQEGVDEGSLAGMAQIKAALGNVEAFEEGSWAQPIEVLGLQGSTRSALLHTRQEDMRVYKMHGLLSSSPERLLSIPELGAKGFLDILFFLHRSDIRPIPTVCQVPHSPAIDKNLRYRILISLTK